MINPQFIIDTMREQDFRYYQILDTNYHVVTAQWQPISVEESIKRFKSFLKNASAAVYRVQIFNTNERKSNGDPKGQPYVYEIMMSESLKDDEPVNTPIQSHPQMQPTPMMGIQDPMQQVFTQGGMLGGVGLDKYLGEKDRILELLLRIQQLEMDKRYLEEKLERREAELRKEMESQMSSEQRINGIINQVLPSFMAGFQGQAPMNGVQPQTMENNTISNEKKMVITSVNKLMEIDPNFSKNITALAKLAETKPEIYAMAVNYLNNL